jgi:proteic killer suppression protein
VWNEQISFRHRGLKRLFEPGEVAQVRADMREKVENILSVLDAATVPENMDLLGFRLHPLKGELRGLWAVTARANWRTVSRFDVTNTRRE